MNNLTMQFLADVDKYYVPTLKPDARDTFVRILDEQGEIVKIADAVDVDGHIYERHYHHRNGRFSTITAERARLKTLEPLPAEMYKAAA